MAITVSTDTKASLELPHFLELVRATTEARDLDSLIASATLLKQLSNNRQFLVDHVNRSFLDGTLLSENSVGDTSFCLATVGPLCLRANVWAAPNSVAADGRWQANMASYLTPHDHPFSFATVGYLGSGYATTIFEYDRSKIAGEPGEHVDLQFLEKTTLPEGKVMVYRACKDVHYQSHPDEFSISLNLIAYPTEKIEQYAFDIDRSQVLDSAMTPRRSQVLLCTLAGVLGDSRTSNVLEEVIHTSPDEIVRLSAFDAWSSLERAEEVWKMALSDPHECVRTRALTELQAIT